MTASVHIPLNPFAPWGGELDETPVRAIMRSGVISMPEDASLRQAMRAMAAHAVHAILIVGARDGTPIGWVTARGVLTWLTRDAALAPAGIAITEPVVWIEPTASAADVVRLLADTGATHLLVAYQADVPPQGVVSELDIVRLVAG
ncbi:MAG TPA: CBS domain-containing protein [Solirubrobacteraceae bacterium]|nr:CBS domain-containing protein [Solirubrobacteraceae bacterium]